MTNRQLFIKNLEISSEFSRYVLKHPRFADRIPRNAVVVFLPKSLRMIRHYVNTISNWRSGIVSRNNHWCMFILMVCEKSRLGSFDRRWKL